MSSRLPLTLSTQIFGSPGNVTAVRTLRPAVGVSTGVFVDRPAAAPVADMRRVRIWEISRSLHCSIVGTCLSNAELRHILVKLGVTGAERSSDHELHEKGVLIAGSRDGGAKFL
jgi:hypothetical protein